MLIVGELINTSRKQIKQAVQERDSLFIKDIAQKQADAGAKYIDVNCGTVLKDEPEAMSWLVNTIQKQVDLPLCIDSPNPLALMEGLELCRNGQPMINSISGERERFDAILPLILKYNAKVVALCMDDTGMPESSADRLRVADNIIKSLNAAGVTNENIYLDPLVKPVSTADQAGREVLGTIQSIKGNYPGVHLICGLSNVSYGLPNRKVLNQTFMIQTMTMGMDSYILDPLDKTMMGFVHASRALLGKDEFCLNYIKQSRKGLYD